MTDNEIIKALECCVSSTSSEACEGCPFNEMEVCDSDHYALEKYTLSIINRQKAEIERLTKEKEEQDQAIINALHRMEEIRSEAVKEFAERANEKLSYYLEKCGDFAPYGMADIIVNIVKEMTEDGE